MNNKLIVGGVIYLGIGALISTRAAPMSWRGQGGNLPFWFALWPWPVAAQMYKEIYGEYPDWTPEV